MRKIKLGKLLPLALVGAIFMVAPGCSPKVQHVGKAPAPVEAAVKADENIYQGKIMGISRKAKSISIRVGKETKMVSFDDDTTGLGYIVKGHAAIISFELRDGKEFATVIKPKLVKLPEGVTTIEPEEVAALVALGPEKGNYMLIDSRPASRYHQAHIPTSVSIPVPLLEKEWAKLLPADKNTLLVFY